MILFNGFLSAAVDSSGTGSSGFRDGLRSPAGIHLRGPAMRLILRRFQAVRGGLRPGVASQKIGPDASDMPRFARQHTKCTGRNREINGLAGCGEGFCGQPGTACPKNRLPHLFGECFRKAKRWAHAPRATPHPSRSRPPLDPDWTPGWILGSSRARNDLWILEGVEPGARPFGGRTFPSLWISYLPGANLSRSAMSHRKVYRATKTD